MTDEMDEPEGPVIAPPYEGSSALAIDELGPQGTNEPDPAIVSVSGQGVVTAVPDMVTVSDGGFVTMVAVGDEHGLLIHFALYFLDDVCVGDAPESTFIAVIQLECDKRRDSLKGDG